MPIKDSLGERIKSQYEHRTRYHLTRRTFTLIRVDGKAFHTYTRNCQRPFDPMLMEDMDFTAKAMCEQIQGAKLAYVQSDEISIVLTDFDTDQTDAWFDGNIQKMVSISASLATAAFNAFRMQRLLLNAEPGSRPDLAYGSPHAYFDSRIFQIPQYDEVLNYFIWRQGDAVRNSIQMAGTAHFEAERLHGVGCNQIQEMLFQDHGINWNDYPVECKRGRVVVPVVTEKAVDWRDPRTGEMRHTEGVKRRVWDPMPAPDFAKDRAFFAAHVPSSPRP